ncbi:caldesmon [Asparagus officinalis]|nr:caldesmon [Asparagus officinalis]
MIEKLLHRGYGFDQFRRSFSRHMPMFREEGYPELADSFTADFAVLESEVRELKELKANGVSSFVSSQMEHRLAQWRDMRSSIGNELQSHEHSAAQLMATVARKDADRAELLHSLESSREDIARLKEALKHAEESATLIAEDLAGLERSREQTLEKLGYTQERLMQLKNEAAKILSGSEEAVRASLQADLERSYVDRLSSLESHVLSRERGGVVQISGETSGHGDSSESSGGGGGDIVRRVVKDKLSELAASCSSRKSKNSKDEEGEGEEMSVQKDALLAFAESTRIFIHYLSATANDICKESRRQTINADDVLKAIEEIEFPEFIEPLRASLEEFRKKNASKRSATNAKARESRKKQRSDNEEPRENEEHAEEVAEEEEKEEGEEPDENE